MSATTELHGSLIYHYPEVSHLLESAIIESSQKTHMPAGTVIYRETEPCTVFMWLLEGTVRVFKHSPGGREITLYRVVPGELCVLSLQCLMEGQGFPAIAVAETDLLGMALSKHEFNRAIEGSIEFRSYLLKLLSQRIGDVMHLVSDITFHHLDLRLACLLGELFEYSGGEPLQITHAKLAQELGTTREMISRNLKELEHRQCIQLSRGEIYLLSKEALDESSTSY